VLSRSSQYAVRALAYLAMRERGQWVLTRQIAAAIDIPSPFLAKILQVLALEGILESQRGRNGGFRLVRDPDRLPLFDIVEAFDRLGQGRLCVLGQKVCSDETACPLHHTWKHSVNSFRHRLQTTTLTELSRHPNALGFPGRLPTADAVAPDFRRPG
jgi:Rrf2 family iron-sulfur cluster assembly transcriptional regulator